MRAGSAAFARRAAPAAAVGICLAVVLSYAALLPRAHWQGDEYFLLALMRDQGWALQKSLYLHWSPRPFSNALYAAYGHFVNAARRPFAARCMALLWVALGCACILPAWVAPAHRGARVLMGLALFALLLTGHAVTEVYFWPGGGLSYVPTLAGAVWLFWCLSGGMPATSRGRLAAAGALAIAAGSSEVGMFLALAAGGCIAAWEWRGGGRRLWWLAPGMAVAALDLGLLLFGRVGTASEAAGVGSTTVHHAGLSLIAAVPRFIEELIAPDSDVRWPGLRMACAASRLAALVAARLSGARLSGARLSRSRLSMAGAPSGALLAYAAGLLVAAFATIASAYYQFGVLCCERHDTMRACYITLAFVCVGVWSAGRWPMPRDRPNARALAWGAAVLLVFAPRIGDIAADIRSTPQAIAARAQNWASGAAPGPDMAFTQEPAGRVITSTNLPKGKFTRADGTPWYDAGILNFFKKNKVEIR